SRSSPDLDDDQQYRAPALPQSNGRFGEVAMMGVGGTLPLASGDSRPIRAVRPRGENFRIADGRASGIELRFRRGVVLGSSSRRLGRSQCIVVFSRSSHVLFSTRPGTSLVWQALVAARFESAPGVEPVVPAADCSARFRAGETRAACRGRKNSAGAGPEGP